VKKSLKLRIKLFVVSLLFRPAIWMVRLVTVFVKSLINLQGPKPESLLHSEALQIIAGNPKLFQSTGKRQAALIFNHADKVSADAEAFFNNAQVQNQFIRMKASSEAMMNEGQCGMIKRKNSSFKNVEPLEIPLTRTGVTVLSDVRLQQMLDKLKDYAYAAEIERDTDEDLLEVLDTEETDNNVIVVAPGGAIDSIKNAVHEIEKELNAQDSVILGEGYSANVPEKKKKKLKPKVKSKTKLAAKKVSTKKPSKRKR